MKNARIPIVIVIALLIVFIISIPLVNNHSAKQVERQLLDIALPEDTQVIESIAKAAKLVGNGNGMQYFGALLIQSDQTLEELSAYYSEKLPGAVVKEQKTQQIPFLDKSISFASSVAGTENYYIVYLFGSGIPPFTYLDLRGH